MCSLGRVRIGHKAPDFHCDAIIKGCIEEVSLESYISEKAPQWLILLFIPAAFSFVCPTEVLAFQNCLDEFKDRNCDVVFVSVDTKHSLWHWQNVPRRYGGLGQIDIALLSDVSHKMSRDYGVLIEEEGVCLRGMFIVDDLGIIQQVTLNNLTVGRSVLEALRLLEAFQAVAKHGVLCPVDWKPDSNTADTINTISNTLTESYEERLANLQKEFGGLPVIDLDLKHEEERKSSSVKLGRQESSSNASNHTQSSSAHSGSLSSQMNGTAASPSTSLKLSSLDCLPRKAADAHMSNSAPNSASVTPMPTPSGSRPSLIQRLSNSGTARHSRGHSTTVPPPPGHKLRTISTTSIRSQSSPKSRNLSHSDSSLPKSNHFGPNAYESRRGSQVILEFADPIAVASTSPIIPPGQSMFSFGSVFPSSQPVTPGGTSSHTSSPSLSRTTSNLREHVKAKQSPPGSQTRLQMTFEAIKKVGQGLTSPRVDVLPRKPSTSSAKEGLKTEDGDEERGSGKNNGGDADWGYFDVSPGVGEA